MWINNENSTNLSADSLQAPQIQIVWGFLSGPRDRQWDHVLILISKSKQPVACIESAQFVFQMLWKELPKLHVLDTRKTSGFLSLGISSIICVIEIDFYCPYQFLIYFYIYFFKFAGEGVTGMEQLQGRKVTLACPKSDIGRAEKSHKGQNVTLERYNMQSNIAWICIIEPIRLTCLGFQTNW